MPENQLVPLVCLVCRVYLVGPTNQIFQMNVPVFGYAVSRFLNDG
jgi:hypothetical protein